MLGQRNTINSLTFSLTDRASESWQNFSKISLTSSTPISRWLWRRPILLHGRRTWRMVDWLQLASPIWILWCEISLTTFLAKRFSRTLMALNKLTGSKLYTVWWWFASPIDTIRGTGSFRRLNLKPLRQEVLTPSISLLSEMLCISTARRLKIDTFNTQSKLSCSLPSLFPTKVWTFYRTSLTTRLTQRNFADSRATLRNWRTKQLSRSLSRASWMISCIQLVKTLMDSANSQMRNSCLLNPDRQCSLLRSEFTCSMNWKGWREGNCEHIFAPKYGWKQCC